MILEDATNDTMCVVEIQLGRMDSLLIEYWDIEKTRNPSCNYKAVLMAEDISRYLNVITLYHTIIQMVVVERADNNRIFYQRAIEVIENEKIDEHVNEEWWLKKVGSKKLEAVKEVLNMTNDWSL